MTSPPKPSAVTLAKFDVHTPVFVDKSGLATVWKVQCRDGSPAALKCYFDEGMRGERPGFSWLKALDGLGAAKVFAVHNNAALLEWLDGPSLGDLSRAGQDAVANQQLVKTACKLHSTAIKPPADLLHLVDWFTALADCKPPDTWSAQTKHNMQRGHDLAKTLLANQTNLRPLHGDLHHDNIKKGARGYLAFDAKGVVGDRAYELANAFKNPFGAETTVQNPARIKHLAQSWGQAFQVDPAVLLDWACAHCALSYAWHLEDGQQPDMVMLNLLFDARDGT